MNLWKKILCLVVILNTAALVWDKNVRGQGTDVYLATKIRRFAPTVMIANTAQLSPNDRKALQKIIAAAKIYDALYLRQIWSGNEALLKKLQADNTPLGRLR